GRGSARRASDDHGSEEAHRKPFSASASRIREDPDNPLQSVAHCLNGHPSFTVGREGRGGVTFVTIVVTWRDLPTLHGFSGRVAPGRQRILGREALRYDDSPVGDAC